MVRQGTAWSCTADIVRHSRARLGTACYGTAGHGLARHGTAQYDARTQCTDNTTWHGTRQYGTARIRTVGQTARRRPILAMLPAGRNPSGTENENQQVLLGYMALASSQQGAPVQCRPFSNRKLINSAAGRNGRSVVMAPI